MVTKEQVKGAIECRWRLNQSKTFGIILLLVAFFTGVCILMAGIDSDQATVLLLGYGIAVAVFACCFLPFSVFYLWQYFRIIRRWDRYELCRAVLDRPGTSGMYRGAVYYTVTFTAKDGQKVTMDTKPLWTGGVFAAFRLEEYNNQTVELLYDPEEERTVVLGLAKK